MADWAKIRAEYIRGGISYRDLAKKHGVTFARLQQVAKAENWVELRKKAYDKALTKSAERIGARKALQVSRITMAADGLLDLIDKSVADMLEADQVSPKDISSLANALEKIKGIKGELSDLDREEQEARIRKIQNDINDSSGDRSITVSMEGDLNAFSG